MANISYDILAVSRIILQTWLHIVILSAFVQFHPGNIDSNTVGARAVLSCKHRSTLSTCTAYPADMGRGIFSIYVALTCTYRPSYILSLAQTGPANVDHVFIFALVQIHPVGKDCDIFKRLCRFTLAERETVICLELVRF